MTLRTPRTALFSALLLATLSLAACSDSNEMTDPAPGQDLGGSDPSPGQPPGTPTDNGTPGNDESPDDGPTDGAGLPDEVAVRLERALTLYRGQPLELAAAVVERFDAPGSGVVERSREPADSSFASRTAERVEFDCSNGGTVISQEETDADGLVRQRDTLFSNCRVGAFDVDGDARRGANPVRDDLTLPAPYSADDLMPFYPRMDLVLTDSRDGTVVATGADAQAFTSFADPNTARDNVLLRRNWATGSDPLSITDADGAVTLANLGVGIAYTDDGTGQIGRTSLGGIDVQISGAGANGLRSIDAVQDFEREIGDANPVAGSIAVRGDGFSYTLDAANGDPDTYQLTVEADGVTTAYTVPWSMPRALETFQPSAVDLGF